VDESERPHAGVMAGGALGPRLPSSRLRGWQAA
jgi:hypothetical protein